MPRNTLPLLMVCLCNLAFAQTNINFDSLQRLVDKDPQRTVAYLDSVEATLRWLFLRPLTPHSIFD